MSDKPIKVCPKCKARKVEKLISHTSFQLKGGGWYSDLYSSQKPGSATSSTSSTSSTSPPESSGDKASSTPSSTPTSSESKGKGKGKKGSTKEAA